MQFDLGKATEVTCSPGHVQDTFAVTSGSDRSFIRET